ncbi:hypothetical protein Q8W71_21065 [Methylobacterium sp. NEAU 140]|uniref:DUF6931 family protein n=1 Tax=Methylobacterium sp. NEAU 140 TaxID=3064945 RepID=UPI002734F696|nr:hypothetical protein [Methylobacterium sp. NEAU 140]MDP4025125.1 hypothetical protein [Methylobacterium sp. NEAU 140]
MSRSTDPVPAGPLAKVAAERAAAICARVELSAEGMAGLLPGLSPQGFLSVLIGGRHFADAIRFLAHALPAREGVWWACVVAGRAPLSEGEGVCLDRAEAWVYEPTDARRRVCLPAAEALAFKGAAAYAALAAFWSGGSLAPEGMAEVPPHPDLAAIGVGASLLLAAAAGDPLRADDTFREILVRGIDIAGGGNGRLAGDRSRTAAGGAA